MQKFRTRVALVEACRWSGNIEVSGEIPASLIVVWANEGRAFITTPEGDRELTAGDWIVKDGSGTYFPMSDDLFQQKYEPAQRHW